MRESFIIIILMCILWLLIVNIYGSKMERNKLAEQNAIITQRIDSLIDVVSKKDTVISKVKFEIEKR